MNYQKTIKYLFAKLPMYQRIGKTAFKKDLTNIIALCEHLGNPQNQYPAIHIAGTNGKGSVANMLSAIFQTAGYKTGLYTSPHYKDFRERIRYNGKLVSKKFVVDCVKENKDIIETINPSFFEISVAMAFQYFYKKNVDIAIIETGLGGRLDSTNIIIPEISIITNISLDHQQFLGNTLSEIASEKAGIIKRNTPVIIGRTQKETKHVFIKKAKEKNAPVTFADKDFKAILIKENIDNRIFDIKKGTESFLKDLEIDISGDYQSENLITVLSAVDVFNSLKKFPEIGKHILRKALKNIKKLTGLTGRWQILSKNPLIIADSAHNEEGIKTVFSTLGDYKFENLHIILGVVNDKAIDKILPVFPKKAKYYFAKADIPRGLDAKILCKKAKTYGLKGDFYTSVKEAFASAKKSAGEDDLILVTGSVFVVAEVPD